MAQVHRGAEDGTCHTEQYLCQPVYGRWWPGDPPQVPGEHGRLHLPIQHTHEHYCMCQGAHEQLGMCIVCCVYEGTHEQLCFISEHL